MGGDAHATQAMPRNPPPPQGRNSRRPIIVFGLRRNARPGNFTGHMDLGLNGKPALITAASVGTGFEIARAPAREGARVIINGRNRSGVDVAIHQNHKGAATRRGAARPCRRQWHRAGGVRETLTTFPTLTEGIA
jgi:hypothetical protein